MESTNTIELRDAYSKDMGAFCHYKIEDSNLVITLDYDDSQFAAWTYLKLTDPNYEKTLKSIMASNQKIKDYVLDEYAVEYASY